MSTMTYLFYPSIASFILFHNTHRNHGFFKERKISLISVLRNKIKLEMLGVSNENLLTSIVYLSP